MKKVGFLTSGGDCQALNATMRGVAKALYNELGTEVELYGFEEGYKGLIYNEYRQLTPRDFSGILTKGGTILGSSRESFKTMRIPDENGLDKVAAMKQNYRRLELDCLVLALQLTRFRLVALSFLHEEFVTFETLHRNFDLLVVFGVHEAEVLTIIVEVLEIPVLDCDVLCVVLALHCLRKSLSCCRALEFQTDECRSLSRVYEFALNAEKRLTLYKQCGAFLNLSCFNHYLTS